jgi:hypothetical protein
MKSFSGNRPVILLLLALCLQTAKAQDTLKTVPDSSHKDKRYFELSLGHSLLFISNTQLEDIRKQASVIVPTSAWLFFAEFRPDKRMRIPVFLNVPTETKQFLVDSQLVYERASPTFGAGLQFRIMRLPIGKKSSVEFEAGPLASFLISQKNDLQFAPIVAGRLRFLKNKDFVIYFGSSYSVGINVFGLLFGTGYVF